MRLNLMYQIIISSCTLHGTSHTNTHMVRCSFIISLRYFFVRLVFNVFCHHFIHFHIHFTLSFLSLLRPCSGNTQSFAMRYCLHLKKKVSEHKITEKANRHTHTHKSFQTTTGFRSLYLSLFIYMCRGKPEEEK